MVAPSVDISELETGFHRIISGESKAFSRLQNRIIQFQRSANPVYARFAPHIYLPIRAFKDTVISCFDPKQAEAVFLSSGTGNQRKRSTHYVYRLDIYRKAVTTHFEAVFGSGPFTFQFCLPRPGPQTDHSSLVRMALILRASFGSRHSGFLTDKAYDARAAVEHSNKSGLPVVVFGTAFGILDWLDEHAFPLPENALVLETGGMKTHRREISRKELHRAMADGFEVETARVRSEYGMCELLSQFYSAPNGLFYAPPWVSFTVFDPEDPQRELSDGQEGILAVFDAANMYSVSAVLTEDRAVRRGEAFDLLGRLSGAELRGCNFLLEHNT